MPDRTENPDDAFQLQPAISDPSEARRLHGANAAAWDDAAGEYTKGREERLARARAGVSSLHPIELANLGRLGPLPSWCHDAVHLQCASGQDTISLLTEGVERVTGIDISPVHIENARWLAGELGVPADFICCDVLDTPAELDGRFDLVYTGMGALCWLHDIEAWARVVARLLKPGGVIHAFDNHPMMWMFDDLSEDLRVYPGVSYFDQAGTSTGWSPGYLPELDSQRPVKHERSWTFADIVNALISVGLRIEYLGEHREAYFNHFVNLRPEELARIPQTFSVLARREGG